MTSVFMETGLCASFEEADTLFLEGFLEKLEVCGGAEEFLNSAKHGRLR